MAFDLSGKKKSQRNGYQGDILKDRHLDKITGYTVPKGQAGVWSGIPAILLIIQQKMSLLLDCEPVPVKKKFTTGFLLHSPGFTREFIGSLFTGVFVFSQHPARSITSNHNSADLTPK